MKNILLVTIDSLRADHVGYHGYSRNVTPNIDSCAQHGSQFMNAHAHVGGTKFSFPSILAGVTPRMYGGEKRITDDQTLLSEVFQASGYQTGGFTCNLYTSAQFGYDRGWDEFFDSDPDESITSRFRKWAKTTLDGAVLDTLRKGYNFLESNQGVNIGSYHVPADDMTDRAISFIKQNSDEPSFVWLHYMDVHHPFLPPTKYQREFRSDLVSDTESIRLRRKYIEEPENVTAEEHQKFIDLYDAVIKFTDAQIGRLIDTVNSEWGENYIIALTADHGDHFLEHGYFSGAKFYYVKTHVTLLINGWDDSNEYQELVGLADLPTTLVDTVGLNIPENYHGDSLRQLVFNKDWERTSVAGGYSDPEGECFHIRTDGWNLMTYPNAEDKLYYLREDPSEQKNVVTQYPDKEAELRDQLSNHKQLVRSTERGHVTRPNLSEDARARLRRLGYDE